MEQELIIGPTVDHSRENILFRIVSDAPAEMIRKTAAKYDAWDAVLEKNTLEDGTEEEISAAYSLLEQNPKNDCHGCHHDYHLRQNIRQMAPGMVRNYPETKDHRGYSVCRYFLNRQE